ncbi:unnamed protein product [Urochloa humidicola]
MGDIKTLKLVDFGQFRTAPYEMVDKVIRKYVSSLAYIHCMRFVRDSTGHERLYCEFGSHKTASAVKDHFEGEKKKNPSSILFEWSYINLQEEYMPIRLQDNIEISYKERQPDEKKVQDDFDVPDVVDAHAGAVEDGGTWFNDYMPWQDYED